MKRFTAFIVLLVIIASLLLTACGGNGDVATDLPPESSGTSTDVSTDTSTDNSDQSGEEAELLYKGDVYLDYRNRQTTTLLIHTTPDYSADLPNTLKVLNHGNWQEVKTEIDITDYRYLITVGDDKVYYETRTNSFYDPKRNMMLFARQDHLDMTANIITSEIEDAVYKYPTHTLPNTPKAEYAKFIEGSGFKYNATGYEVKLTFADVVNAKNIEAHNVYEIVAIYDGKRTHVFNCSTGELLASQDGQFLGYACNNGGFMEGAPDTTNGKRCIYYEEREHAIYLEEGHWHEGGARKLPVYYTEDKKTAYFPYGENDYGYGYGGYSIRNQNNYAACRYAEINKNIDKAVAKWEDVVNVDTIGKYGVVFGGETVIPFEFDKIDTFQGRRGYYDAAIPCFGVYRAVKDGKTYYYSTNGTNLTPDGFVCGSQPRENRATVYDGKKLFVIEFTTEEIFDPAEILVAKDKGTGFVPVGEEAGEEIYKIITADGWVDGLTDCHYNYKFCWDDAFYYYDSVCGTFADITPWEFHCYKTVSEEQRNKINGYLNYNENNPTVEIPPNEELYSGHLYIYTGYATYYETEKHDQSGTHNKAVSQIMLNAQWQEGEKSGEEYHYYIEFGHCRTATVNYNEVLGLLWDEENNRYAYLDRATNLRLSALMRAPDTAISGIEKTEQFTVAPYTISKQSIADNYFIAVNEKGEYLQIVWDQTQELSEGCVVNVTYDTPFVLNGTIYFYFNDRHGYDVENGISAYDVTIVKKPEAAPLDKNREIDFNLYRFAVDLKNYNGTHLGRGETPIVITSREALDKFFTAFPDSSAHNNAIDPYGKLTENYFRDHSLIMLHTVNKYLFTDYEITKIHAENGVLTVDYTATAYPGIKTSKISDSLFVMEVNAHDISDCTEFKFNATLNDPKITPPQAMPKTVEYEYHYNYVELRSGALRTNEVFSVSSYKILKELLDKRYTLVNEDYETEPPVESLLYQIDEEFFKEKALICVALTIDETVNCDDLLELKVDFKSLIAKRKNNTYTNDATHRDVLCFFVVDKDVVTIFSYCRVNG